MAIHEPGSEVAGYRIESLIGRGGMAVVYRAEDLRLGRKVALKLLTPQLADNEQFRQRFIRESRLAASLDHPNIVPIYEAGEADGQLFIAMRYVLGHDLKGLLAQHDGQLPVETTTRLMGQVGDALDSAHRAGLVHRDVKPGNILVATGERPRLAHGEHVYLTDFGLTKRTSELSGGLTGTGNFLGTVDYVAPEQIQGRPVGAGTDIYAVGCVLYECLTGQLPFRRDDDAALLWAHLVDTPPSASAIRPELPEAVDAVVARAMAKDPADRYPSCEELVRELEQAVDMPVTVSSPRIPRAQDSRSATGVPVRPPQDGAAGYSLAIDLGTSFVAAAVADDHGLEMFGLGDGSTVVPAAVFVRDDGRLVTGDAAARRAVSRPDRVARDVKRSLGNPTPVLLGGAPYAVGDLLGALLQDVLAQVAERQGAKPDVVALTHPANWGPFRKAAFEDVARAAGLADPLYTTEPEAAAAYYASTRPLGEGEVIAVYDLGGGTFDATVLRRTTRGFEIVGTPEGIERLGGADFDDAIFAHVNYLAGGALTGVDLSDERTVVAVARLRQDCTLAKEALSVDVETVIPVFLPNRHFEVTLTRAELESMIRAPIESTIGTLDRVLRAAQVDRTSLAAILLVGGSSRIPLVGQMVSEAFGRPTVVGAHPKHAVALGAVLYAEARRKDAEVAFLARAEARRTSTGAPTVADRGSESIAPVASGGRGTSGPASFWTTAPAPVPAAEAGSVAVAPRAAAGPVAGAESPVEVPAPRAGEPAPYQPLPGGPVAHLPFAGGPGGGGPPGGPPFGGAAPGGAPPRPKKWWKRWWVPVVAGLVVLALAGAAVLVYVNNRSSARSPAASSGSGGAISGAPARPSLPGNSAAPPASAASPASAVPLPPVAGTVTVGPTPNFVVAAPNDRQLFVASPGADAIFVVDTTAKQVTATIKVDAGPPRFLAFSPDGRVVYISVFDDARTIAAVAVLDTATLKITKTIPVRTRPFLAAVTADGKRIFVPNHDTGTVSVVDTASGNVIKEIQVPPNPHSVAFNPSGSRAYIADHESNVVSVVDTSSYAVLTSIPVPQSPHNVAVHPTRPFAMVASYDAASVSVIDTNTNTVVKTIGVHNQPQHIAYSADGRFAYVTNDGDNSVSVIELDTFTETERIPTGKSPTSMAVLRNGKEGYVSNLDDGTLTVVNLAG
jgi:YVTN family beta-propeller protein